MANPGEGMKHKRDTHVHDDPEKGPATSVVRIAIYGVAALLIFLPVAVRIQGDDETMRASAAGTNASLSLPPEIMRQQSQSIDLPIVLNTDAAVIGAVDVSLTFDPAMMLLADITPGATGTSLKTFVPVNSTYAFDVATVVSLANSTGKIAFGAATFDPATQSPTAGYAGTTELALLHFTARQGGRTAVTFNIGASTASTIVQESNPPQNLLTQPAQATNAIVDIVALPQGRSGGASGSPAPPLPQPRLGAPTPQRQSPEPLPPSRP